MMKFHIKVQNHFEELSNYLSSCKLGCDFLSCKLSHLIYRLLMNDFLQHLSRIQREFQNAHYEACIRECGSAMERGLRLLYTSLKDFLGEQEMGDKWTAMHEEYINSRNQEFNFQRGGFGGMIMFAVVTNFWENVRMMCTSNLSFLPMINWYRARELRNNAVHQIGSFSKNDAMEMIFYTKVFLYDCELIEGVVSPAPMILGVSCLNCNQSIDRSWNYCPFCATKIVQSCVNCHRELDPSHRICPSCDTQRLCGIDQTAAEKNYLSYCKAVWADFVVTPAERQWLNAQRLELGLTLDKADEIERRVIPKHYHTFMMLIEAVNIDGKIDTIEEAFLISKADEFGIPKDIATNLISTARDTPKRIRKNLLDLK